MVLILLIAIPLAIILIFFEKRQFLFGISIAIILCVIDFSLKTINNRPSDLEGFGVANLVLIFSYVVSGLIITITIITKLNLRKGIVFLLLFALIASVDLYLFGMYKTSIYSRGSGIIEVSKDKGFFSNEYLLKDKTIILGEDTIEIGNIWSENQQLIKNGIGRQKDTTFIKDHFIQFTINKTSDIYKIYCTINGGNYESFGKSNYSENGLETYTIINKNNLDNIDYFYFKIGRKTEWKKLKAVRNE